MTILNQIDIIKPNTVLYFIFLIIMIVVFSFIFYFIEKYNSVLTFIFIPIAIASMVFCILTGCKAVFPIHTDRQRYECIINENTSFSEIAEKYDIVEKRGDIWILEDKEIK